MYPAKSKTLPSGQSLTIRPAKAEDAARVIEYVNLIAGETDNITFGPGEFDKTVEEEQQFITHINSTANSLFVVGLVGEEIVAVSDIHAGTRPRTRHFGGLGITVRKDFWRMGIGQAILQYLIDWAAQGGIIKKINLEVREDNPPAIKLYEKMGFAHEGTISRHLFIKGQFITTRVMGLEIGE